MMGGSLEGEALGLASRRPWLPWALVVTFGLLLGVLAKLADQSRIPGIGAIGTHMGFWVVVVTLIAVASPSRALAAARVAICMGSVVIAYYLVTRWLFGVFPMSYFATWAFVALSLTPVFAATVWSARSSGLAGCLASSLPAGFLLAEAWSFRFVLPLHGIEFAFDLIAAALVLAVLGRPASRLAIMLGFTIITGVAVRLVASLIPYAAGVLSQFGLRF